MENNNSNIFVSGIMGEMEYSHTTYGEKFYKAFIHSKRISGTEDIVPVMIPERLIDMRMDFTGANVSIYGEMRSHNKEDEGRKRLEVFAFAKEVVFKTENSKNENTVELSGYICKSPSYRETPLGREIADVLLAVNRPYGKSDYIPCICWGRNARFASGLAVGTHIMIHGRLQSRVYEKKFENAEPETRMTYEVSVCNMEVIDEA